MPTSPNLSVRQGRSHLSANNSDTRREDSDSLLVMNGDLLTEIDLRRLIDFHEEGGNDITVVTRDYQLKHPYGVIELDGDRITSVVEKPTVIDTINAGIYVFRWSALELVPDGQAFEMPDLLNTALDSGLT